MELRRHGGHCRTARTVNLGPRVKPRNATIPDIASWTALQAELVEPRQLPDGVLSALEYGQSEPDVYILEIASYPDARVPSQAVRDTALVLLERQVLP